VCLGAFAITERPEWVHDGPFFNPLLKRHQTLAKVHYQTRAPEKVKAKHSVNGCTWWKGVANNGKVRLFSPQCFDPLHHDLGSELDAAAGRHSNSLPDNGRIVSQQYGDVPVH